MKLLAAMALALALTFSSVQSTAQKPEPQVRSYDAGVCGSTEFMGVHLEVTDKSLSITAVSTGPGEAHASKNVLVYTIDKKDELGQHYILMDGDDVFSIVIKVDGDDFAGFLLYNGEKAAYVFGNIGDGKDLAKNAQILYGVCRDLRQRDRVDPNMNQS
jgi:hypothetical protein